MRTSTPYKLSVAELLLQVALLKDILEKILFKAALTGSGNIWIKAEQETCIQIKTLKDASVLWEYTSNSNQHSLFLW